jgi:RHS repeat-associated protein
VRGGRPAPDQAARAAPAIGYRGELTVDGLIWLRNRAYDPASRAFLAPDPLPPVPGTAYAANPYHYAGNDPINAVDPLGLRPLTDADLAAARLAGGVGPLALPGGVPAGTDPYRGLSPVNGLLQAGDVAGGFYGAKLEVDGHFARLTGEYDRALADRHLAQLRQQGRVVNPAQFYDDLDHYTALGRQGDDLIANAGRLERAAKLTPPKIGGGLAVAGIGYDIATGKDPVQAVAAGGGGFAASVLAGAMIGSFIPVPGVGTAVGALGGAVVGTFTSGAIDSLFEDGLDAGAALGRGFEAVGDTGKAIGGGVMKVAEGIGGLFD